MRGPSLSVWLAKRLGVRVKLRVVDPGAVISWRERVLAGPAWAVRLAGWLGVKA